MRFRPWWHSALLGAGITIFSLAFLWVDVGIPSWVKFTISAMIGLLYGRLIISFYQVHRARREAAHEAAVRMVLEDEVAKSPYKYEVHHLDKAGKIVATQHFESRVALGFIAPMPGAVECKVYEHGPSGTSLLVGVL